MSGRCCINHTWIIRRAYIRIFTDMPESQTRPLHLGSRPRATHHFRSRKRHIHKGFTIKARGRSWSRGAADASADDPTSRRYKAHINFQASYEFLRQFNALWIARSRYPHRCEPRKFTSRLRSRGMNHCGPHAPCYFFLASGPPRNQKRAGIQAHWG